MGNREDKALTTKLHGAAAHVFDGGTKLAQFVYQDFFEAKLGGSDKVHGAKVEG
jgi:hypothetical protein